MPSKLLRILNRPFKINPPHLTSLVKHSDNSVFRIKTTTPKSLVILTKDTLNHFLWNPSGSKMDDQEGRLKEFNRKYASNNTLDILSKIAEGQGKKVLEKKPVKVVPQIPTKDSKKKK